MKRLIVVSVALVPSLLLSPAVRAQVWNSPGMIGAQQPPQTGPAPPRDLTGTWDAGGAGIAPRGSPTAPLTPWGEKKISTFKPGDGPRAPSVIG